jgi:hypothetical protein
LWSHNYVDLVSIDQRICAKVPPTQTAISVVTKHSVNLVWAISRRWKQVWISEPRPTQDLTT